MVVKKLVEFMVGVCLLLCVGVVQAKEDYNFKWQKVGDSYFDVCIFNKVYFVENVENYNEVKMRSVPREVQEQMDWKTLKSTFNFKKSSVKQWENGKFTSFNDSIGYNYLNYEGKKLSIKYYLDYGRRFIFREENTATPYLQPSKDGSNFVFWDNGEIWLVVPPNYEEPNYILKKLTKETVNGKTREEIQKQLKEGNPVNWSFMPIISSNGSYVAYTSNKDTFSRGEQGFSEIWIIDIQNDDDKMILRDKFVKVYGWMDNTSLVCSLKDSIYIYNIETQKIIPLPLNIIVLNITEDSIVYANKNNPYQLYIYNIKSSLTQAFPQLSNNLYFLADTPVNFYTLSPDKERFFLIAETRDTKTGKADRFLLMLDLITNKIYPVNYQASLEKSEMFDIFGKWVGKNELVVYTPYYENKMEMYRTWVLSVISSNTK